MTRSLEPYKNPDMPNSFMRWVEILRQRIGRIPAFTTTSGTPEGVITGQAGDKYFDSATATWFVKTTNTGNTGWQLENQTPTATTAQLADISHVINTSILKRAGYQVFNTTTGAPVWAVGDTDGAVWNDATGSTAHTPV